jgi:hypothetical protein
MTEKLIEAVHRANEGYWDEAHTTVQQIDEPLSYWLHANLHREEGDLGNARYWYGRAARDFTTIDIVEERQQILTALQNTQKD